MNYCRYLYACIDTKTELVDSKKKNNDSEQQRISDLENDIILTQNEGQTLGDYSLFLLLTEYMESRFTIDSRYDKLHAKYKKLRYEHKLRLIRHMWSMRYDKGRLFNLYLVEKDTGYGSETTIDAKKTKNAAKAKANADVHHKVPVNTLAAEKAETAAQPHVVKLKSHASKATQRIAEKVALKQNAKNAKKASILSATEKFELEEDAGSVCRRIEVCIDWAEENGLELYDDEIFDLLSRNLFYYLDNNLMSVSVKDFKVINRIRRKFNAAGKFHQSRALAKMSDKFYNKNLSEIIRNYHSGKDRQKNQYVTLLHTSQMIKIEKCFYLANKVVEITRELFVETQNKLSRILSMTIESFRTLEIDDSDKLKNNLYTLSESAKRIQKLFAESTIHKRHSVLNYIATNRLLDYSEIIVVDASDKLDSMVRLIQIISETKDLDNDSVSQLTPDELTHLDELNQKLTKQINDAIKIDDHKTVSAAINASGKFIRSGKDHRNRILISFYHLSRETVNPTLEKGV